MQIEDEFDESDHEEENFLMKNFITQKELMSIKEDLNGISNDSSDSQHARLSTAAIEEIHQMYTEGNQFDY